MPCWSSSQSKELDMRLITSSKWFQGKYEGEFILAQMNREDLMQMTVSFVLCIRNVHWTALTLQIDYEIVVKHLKKVHNLGTTKAVFGCKHAAKCLSIERAKF